MGILRAPTTNQHHISIATTLEAMVTNVDTIVDKITQRKAYRDSCHQYCSALLDSSFFYALIDFIDLA